MPLARIEPRFRLLDLLDRLVAGSRGSLDVVRLRGAAQTLAPAAARELIALAGDPLLDTARREG